MTSMLEPSNEAETAAMVLEAGRLSMPLEIVGGGTRPVGGRPAGTRALLSTARLSGVTLYEPASLTVSVRPGTLVSELEELLALEGQHLPFEPADWRHVLSTTGHSTVGGMVAAAAAGPRRIQAGSVRDSAIGVRFVDGSGTIVKNGGRVMKNVTGYDLVKLMCGSFGTLGVLSEITFKVLLLDPCGHQLRGEASRIRIHVEGPQEANNLRGTDIGPERAEICNLTWTVDALQQCLGCETVPLAE
jgi:glycolate oxidase FAD binding subunit